jgi:flagellin
MDVHQLFQWRDFIMSINIQHNLGAMNAQRNMGIAAGKNAKAQEKLSSGYRINRAGDDAAGLAISEKMRGQVKGLTQASRNAQDGVSLIQTAEGALDTTSQILQRMRLLAVQSATDTNTTADRTNLQAEVSALIEEIDRIAKNTQFNNMNVLDGTFSGKSIHVGANKGQAISIAISSHKASALLVDSLKINSQSNANAAISTVNTAINTVSTNRAKLGALQNRLEYTMANLDVSAENLQQAESRIRDTDMASEVLTQTQTNVLQQAAQSMLAIANQQPQSVQKYPQYKTLKLPNQLH